MEFFLVIGIMLTFIGMGLTGSASIWGQVKIKDYLPFIIGIILFIGALLIDVITSL